MMTPLRSRYGIARAMPLLALSALAAGTAALLASARPAHAPAPPTTYPAHAPVPAVSVPARAPSIERPDEYVGVATYSGHDWITGAEIDALLRHHGIDSSQEGSLAYGVSVPRKDVRRAQALIRQDAQEVGYQVVVDRDACGREPPAAWMTVNVGARYSRRLLRSRIGPRTVLHDLLLDAETKETTGRLRRVVDLRLRPRVYHDDHWQPAIGYDLVLHAVGARGGHYGTEWWLTYQWLRPGAAYFEGGNGVEDPPQRFRRRLRNM